MDALVTAVYSDVPDQLRGAAGSNLRHVLLKVRSGSGPPLPVARSRAAHCARRGRQLREEGRAVLEGGDGMQERWLAGDAL